MFCSISLLIFKLEKYIIYQINANVMRIQQNLTVFGYRSTRVMSWEASPLFYGTPLIRTRFLGTPQSGGFLLFHCGCQEDYFSKKLLGGP